jgi:hypothetical protein
VSRIASVGLTMVMLLSATVFGQATRGSLSGTVTDPQGAAVTGANVIAKNNATGEEVRVTTGDQGVFIFPSLAPGHYSVRVEVSGFKRTEVPDVVVETSGQAKVKIGLEVGEVTEQVTVTSENQEIINSTSPVLSKTINAKQVADLPLLSRNPLDLARLQAGLAVNGTDVRNASVQGLRGNATNVTQDGINAMDNFVKGSSFFALTAPSLNATSEFSITVGTVGSDAGRGVAQVTLVTKQGSNEFHGGVFYQHRNDALNANTFFNNATNTPKAIQRQHFFGLSVSGPLWIPKVYDGRNKSFWFYSYEGFREPFSVTRNRTVLTEEARRGIFRYTGANGQLTTVNLLSLGNFHSLNPVTTAQLNAMPLPNNTLNGDGFNTAGFRYNVPGTNPSDRHNFRFDQNLFNSERLGSHKLEATLHRGEFLLTPDTFNGLEAPFPGGANAFQGSTRTLWSAAIHSTFGAYVTNEARFGHNEAPVGFLRESFPDRFFINLTSVTDFDNTFLSQGRNTKLNQFVDNLSLVKGAHTFKMGADIQRVYAYTFNDTGINNQVNIGVNSANPDGIVTGNFPNLPAGSAGTDIFNRARAIYRDLVGSLGSAQRTFNVTSATSGFVPGATRGRAFGYNDVSFFFQDAWRVKRNLTFNYGTRYEYLGVTSATDGLALQITNFNDIFGVSGPGNLFKPGTLGGNASATLDFVSGKTGRSLHKKDWNNFAPFIGFAWSPNFESGLLRTIFGSEGRSSLRGGYSITYLRDGFTIFSNALGVGTTNAGLIQTAANTVPVGVLASAGVDVGIPAFQVPISSATNFTTNSGNGLWAIDPNLASPYVQQWSFGIEREVTPNTAFEIRYAGNHAIKIFRAVDYNEVNIFENGFLQEFLNAQRNLAARGGTSFAPGIAGTVALPIMSTLFAGLPASSGFSSTTFIANLQQNNVGTFAATLANSSTYRANRANLAPNFFLTNPNAAFARVLGNGSFSNYHSLQMEIRRRFSAGLQFQANYTLSRTLNDGTGIVNNQSSLESYRTLRNLRLDYQNSDQDQRHRFVANGVYDLPFGGGRRYLSGTWSPVRKMVSGWTVGAIVTYQSGSPISFTSNRTTFNNFNPGINPAQLVGTTFEEFKRHLGVFKTGAGVFFIDPAMLNLTFGANGQLNTSTLKEGLLGAPAPGTFGNFPLNAIFGPNFTQTDLSIVKRTSFSESGNVEFRMTAFNAFNQTNFTFGGNDFDSASFGRITGTRGNERQFHFAIGINW